MRLLLEDFDQVDSSAVLMIAKSAELMAPSSEPVTNTPALNEPTDVDESNLSDVQLVMATGVNEYVKMTLVFDWYH